jgi:FkbM family methyltransferase
MSELFTTSLNIYRKTIKRVPALHRVTHWVMSHSAIPLLESRQQFHTMKDDPFWFRLELLTGKHEVETMAQVERLVEPGMVILDVGAHVGYYTRRFTDLVGTAGRVLAFEPHPRIFATLQANTANHTNVTPLQLAVAESEGTAELYDYLMMSASGSLHYDADIAELQRAQTAVTDVAPRLREDFTVQTFTVQTRTIDSVVQERGLTKVDFVKMDIEGAEMNALLGMRETIQRSPGLKLIMEYNPQALKAFDYDPTATLHDVLALGFDRVQVIEASGVLTDITGQTAKVSELTERLMRHMDVVNLLFTKGEGA